MIEFFKQMGSTVGAAFAGACCLGAAWALSALAAIGAGFLINDAILVPVYVALLGLSLWLLSRSTRAHGKHAPLWLGAAGALAAIAGLWIAGAVVFAGLAALIGASLWDFLGARRPAARA